MLRTLLCSRTKYIGLDSIICLICFSLCFFMICSTKVYIHIFLSLFLSITFLLYCVTPVAPVGCRPICNV